MATVSEINLQQAHAAETRSAVSAFILIPAFVKAEFEFDQ